MSSKLDWSLSMGPLCCSWAAMHCCTVQGLAAAGVHYRPCLRWPLSLPRAGRLAVPRAVRDGSPRLWGAQHAQLAGRGPPGQSGRQQKAEHILWPAVLPLLVRRPPGRLCWHHNPSALAYGCNPAGRRIAHPGAQCAPTDAPAGAPGLALRLPVQTLVSWTSTRYVVHQRSAMPARRMCGAKPVCLIFILPCMPPPFLAQLQETFCLSQTDNQGKDQ